MLPLLFTRGYLTAMAAATLWLCSERTGSDATRCCNATRAIYRVEAGIANALSTAREQSARRPLLGRSHARMVVQSTPARRASSRRDQPRRVRLKRSDSPNERGAG
jgi:hypothetical protein